MLLLVRAILRGNEVKFLKRSVALRMLKAESTYNELSTCVCQGTRTINMTQYMKYLLSIYRSVKFTHCELSELRLARGCCVRPDCCRNLLISSM